VKRRHFFAALAALPFVGKLIRNPMGPVGAKMPYEKPTLTRIQELSGSYRAAHGLGPVKLGDWEYHGSAHSFLALWD
jgi:hypothetical protein